MYCSICQILIKTQVRKNSTNCCKSCYQKQYRLFRKEHYKVLHKDWLEKNKDKRRQYVNNRQKHLYSTNLLFKIKCIARSRISYLIRGKNIRTASVLGCTIEQFKQHLECKFEPWMSWDNYGLYSHEKETWNIDHIKPLASFDLTNSEQLKQACHYTNLQPLLAALNIKKSDKYE